MTDALVFEAADRLFGDIARPALAAAAEAWPEDAWRAVAAQGFLDALAAPGGFAGVPDATAVMRAAGRHAVPLPLAETMLARWILAAAGSNAPTTPLTLAPVEPEDALEAGFEGGRWRVRGAASLVPWARHASHLVVFVGSAAFLLAAASASFRKEQNLADEPRDHALLDGEGEKLALPAAIDGAVVQRLGALLRAAQIAGALEGVLHLATQYANDRIQFGRPIGKFQAIQQQLAALAEEVAAASVAVAAGAARVAGGGDLFFAAASAKLRAGEAAGKASAIAHQVHGAIGFTHEHPLHHLTRRLWSWRDEFGTESFWALALGRSLAARGAAAFWPTITA
ncbi:MAG: acyl-CoA dehydrogenase [Alphaproteobacteria bacterium]|nr:acyl-CoA dehydrogenase [Alphaproteobacteria bacterium]